MGGECNYLLRVNPHSKQLEFVPDDEWMTPEMLAWDEEDIKVGRRLLSMELSSCGRVLLGDVLVHHLLGQPVHFWNM
jgi:hypothetical protein